MTASLLLLSAHLLGDFPLQPDWMVAEKIDDAGVRFAHVVIHTVLVFVFLSLAGITLEHPLLFYGAYAASHFVIDSRRWVEPKDDFPAFHFIVDQTMHVTAMAWLSVIFL